VDKLNRQYELTIQAIDGHELQFTLPYTIEFSVDRNNYSSPNTATITIYNLAPDTRNQLRKDAIDTDVSRRVTLKVGYGDNLSTVFDGTLDHCWSARQGTNFLTQMEARDNGFVYSNTNVSVYYSQGQTIRSVVDSVVKQLAQKGVTVGYIGDIKGSFPRSGAKQGLAMEILRELTNDTCFIDNNKIFVLGDKEAIIGPFEEISSATGLIGTPVLENTFLKAELILEPRLLICQKIKMNTTTGSNKNNPSYTYGITNFNGDYKITGIAHRGTISPTVAGSATTSVVLSGETVEIAYRGIGV
jgi:hypothetical protein